MIYFLIVLLLCIGGCFLPPDKQRNIFILVLTSLLLLCGLRGHNIGIDTSNYCDLFYGTVDSSRLGFIWEGLISLSHTISSNPSIFLFLSAVITFVPLGLLLYKVSPNPMISLLIFMVSVNKLYFETFNLVRQMAAVMWILYVGVFYSLLISTDDNKDKNWKLYLYGQTCLKKFSFLPKKKFCFLVLAIICFTVAFLLHKIVLIAVPFLFLSRLRLNKTWITGALIISAIIGVSGVLDLFNNMLLLLDSYNSGSTNSFAIYGNYSRRDMTVEWSTISKLAHILPNSLVVYFSYSKHQNGLERLSFNMLFYGTFICNLLVSNVFCDRLTNMMTIFVVFVVAYSMKYNLRTRKPMILLLLAIISFFIHVVIGLNAAPGHDDVLPYEFFF